MRVLDRRDGTIVPSVREAVGTGRWTTPTPDTDAAHAALERAQQRLCTVRTHADDVRVEQSRAELLRPHADVFMAGGGVIMAEMRLPRTHKASARAPIRFQADVLD